MSSVTENISKYIRNKGINLSKMSRDTGIAYMPLYDSLMNEERKRDLRDWEMLKICNFLGVNPMDFADPTEEKGA